MAASILGAAAPAAPASSDASSSSTPSLPAPQATEPKPLSPRATKYALKPVPDMPPLETAYEPWPRPYYLEDGLRRVAPYHFTYNTWCKERWRGRSLLEVFASEFRDKPLEYYRSAMVSGTVRVNDKQVGPDYILKNGDLVSHTTHRHEPPITSEPIRVIFEDEKMMVINKPSGVPVHPAGRYSFNSVVEILKSERGRDFLPHPCNRLDRLTSGIMFIGKTPEAAGLLSTQIQERRVRKEYLARVIGRFPDGDVVCDQPILSISPKLGLNRVRANGKAAKSVFKRLAYYPPKNSSDGNYDPEKSGYSIVRCLPVTGRTHQLRVHLQYLGHPIANDPIYANTKVWGFDLGVNDPEAIQNSDEDIISRLSRMGKEDVAHAVAYYDEMVDGYEKKRAEKLSGEHCSVCNTPLYTDPGEQELCLYLHSLRYEDINGEWGYVSPMPSWALPPEGFNGPTEVGGMEDLVGAAAAEAVSAAEAGVVGGEAVEAPTAAASNS